MKTHAALMLTLAASLANTASAQEGFEERILPFRPSIHGMPFTNGGGWNVPLQIKVGGKTFGWTVEWGFCGGLCYLAADDYYTSNWRPRTDPKPPTHSGLWDLLYKRQVDSLNQAGWAKIYYWQQRPLSGSATNPIHSMRQAVPGEWGMIKDKIDAGELAQVCEISVYGANENPGKNHQTLAYGYRHFPSTGRVELNIYDPNYPNADDIFLEFFVGGRETKLVKRRNATKIRDLRGLFYVPYDRTPTRRRFWANKDDSRPTWMLDTDGDGADEILRYDPRGRLFEIGDYRRGRLCWRSAGSTAHFGQLWDGRPMFTGDFDGDGREEIAFYYPGDGNVWLGRSNGSMLEWKRISAIAHFGNIGDGRPLWSEDFDGDGKTDVLFYYPGDHSWWLGRSTGEKLEWTLAGNTAGFGNLDDGRPMFVLDVDGDRRQDVLFNYPGDHNWWLGRFSGTTLHWTRVGNTAGFGRLDDGRRFFHGDFDRDRRDELVFYSPGDQKWWIADFGRTTLNWRLLCNTNGFGTMNDGRLFHVGDFDGDDRADVYFYSAIDGHHWIGSSDGATLHWSAPNPSFANYGWQTEELMIGDLDGDGKDDLLHAEHPFGNYTQRRSGTSAWTYVAPGCLPSFRSFGYGCPGRVATLQHYAVNLSSGPKLGTTNNFKLQGASPNTAVSLYLGLNRDEWAGYRLPLDLSMLGAKGCTLYVDPLLRFGGVSDAYGVRSTYVTLPIDSSLVGLRLYSQYVSHEPGVQAWPFSYSNAVESVLEL
ncbi:MAG: VCBS repeat-containing protein [Planctomycetes bacterium]|nr:VCBS repeat-containing protein [Planctomycetota bacterium]